MRAMQELLVRIERQTEQIAKALEIHQAQSKVCR
jgi:hypothetical protein